MLQLADLRGDIVATAALSESETKLLSTNEPSEYGVPTTSTPPKYSWLGAEEVSTELPSGQIAMGARSYIPQLGRFLQPDPIPGGSANAYSYTFGDPMNTADPSGALTYGFSGWLKEANNQEAQEVVAREAARETLEREEAERRAAEAQAAAQAAGPTGEESVGQGGGEVPEVIGQSPQPITGGGGGATAHAASFSDLGPCDQLNEGDLVVDSEGNVWECQEVWVDVGGGGTYQWVLVMRAPQKEAQQCPVAMVASRARKKHKHHTCK